MVHEPDLGAMAVTNINHNFQDSPQTTYNTDSCPVSDRTLRSLMSSVHASAQVIWYDAVTVEGFLEWQNSLTHLNRPFFDACDGLFVNYHWKVLPPMWCRPQSCGSRNLMPHPDLGVTMVCTLDIKPVMFCHT